MKDLLTEINLLNDRGWIMENNEKLEICTDVLNYIIAVTEKQERVLDLETMYAAYIATFGQEAGLTQYGFSEVYRSYIEALVDVAIQEGK